MSNDQQYPQQQPSYDQYDQYGQPYAYDPYAQQPPQPQQPQQHYDAPLTQQWQAQTWDTQVQPAQTPYLPPQGYEYGAEGQPLPPQQGQDWAAYDAQPAPVPAAEPA
ncbi:hypothetical protein G3I40_18585, partial [Streptomyces sp. SID14478]|nr:hypothetical protein [Streptomyces sp. SID14478]